MASKYMKGLTKAEQRYKEHKSLWLLQEDLRIYIASGRDHTGKTITKDYLNGFRGYIQHLEDKANEK